MNRSGKEVNKNAGFVYVFSNKEMPGLVKIGRSKHGGESRAKLLYNTGVPAPFKVEFEIFTDDAFRVEKSAHLILAEHRVNDSREFFRVDVDAAILAVLDSYCSSKEYKIVHSDDYDNAVTIKFLEYKHDMDGDVITDALYSITTSEILQLIDRGNSAKKVAQNATA